jgi:hypothetical protein
MRMVVIPITIALMSTSAFAFFPADCGVTDKVGTHALGRYCAILMQKAINSDAGQGLIGRLEHAAPIEGEPGSRDYYWVATENGVAPIYFDGNSVIGRKILKMCTLGRLCAIKVGIKKTWEHNVDHAMFWITKIVGEPIQQ